MTPRCGILVAVIAITCLVQHVSSMAPYYAATSDADRLGSGKYIVVLKDARKTQVDSTAFVTREFMSKSEHEVRSTAYQIDHMYDHVINGFSATLTDDLREQVRSLPEVDFIEEVMQGSIQCLTPPPSPPFVPVDPNEVFRKPDVPSWGLDRIDQIDLPIDDALPLYQANSGRGDGVHIYIIDTGVQRTHNEFRGRFSDAGFDAYNDGVGVDCNGHGTHVAGTAAGATYGVATKATIHSVRVLDCDGSGTSDDILQGMNWVALNTAKPAVVSMSLGLSQVSIAINNAVENLFQRGIVVSVAAGNTGVDACGISPASAPNAITVGATDRGDNRVRLHNWASNFGACLDIFAPGEDITSAWIGADDATNTISGTSMACPHVSGVAAILLGRDPTLTSEEITAKLIASSNFNKVTHPGDRSPNRLLHIDQPIVCEHGQINLVCTNPDYVLEILSVFYGHEVGPPRCSDIFNNARCAADNAAGSVRQQCDGKRSCSVLAKNYLFGGDPCPGTVKYLEIQYACVGFFNH